MSAKITAEEVLLLLAHGLDLAMMPSIRKWNQSHEGWLYENGLLGRLHYLEAQKFLEREGKKEHWVYRITRAGQQWVHGGRNPEEMWNRKWDGWWRLFVFDLPTENHRERSTLIRWLRRNGFGYLQDSVWLSVDPVKGLARCLRGFTENAEAFTVFECRTVRGFSEDALVRGAWLFGEINEGYKVYQKFAASGMKRLKQRRLHPRELFALLREERAQWSVPFRLDPLLPLRLWPSDYEGHRAWQTRKELLRLAASHAR